MRTKKAGFNVTCPATLGSGMPLVVGQVTKSHAVYGYHTPKSACMNIHADIYCYYALATSYLNFPDSE